MYRKLLRFLLAFSIIALISAYFIYRSVAGPEILAEGAETVYVEIPHGTSFEALTRILLAKKLIPNEAVFRSLAKKLNYEADPVRSGRFAVEPGMKLPDFIYRLRNGKQAPVMVVLTTERELTDVAAKVARFIEPDAQAFIQLFQKEDFLDSLGYTKENLMSLFIPNSYELYWDTSPRDFIRRMIEEHDIFWKRKDRYIRANQLELSQADVYTLASIVEKETLQNDEKKRMAGVYYNRLKIGMKLQADPTAVFASRDFNTNRVTNYHLQVDSPYNTYKYKGLPPGPIAMASIASIDAVLNHEQHDYLYFCAKGDGSGYHTFAKNLEAHKRNAEIYRENRRKRGK
ncbi:endolytic transglycosylase MltG [Lewinella cohaerens]|uniref:endolytic transglycosylase MltG n=1 Tax=Lewinella cohaerens TaxID=70995 RepID=UPI00037269AA|nr:endolytic transglycosylase MltG [Lewinella cohaerens]